ncbi:MAG: alpha-glucosidase/alpha-galactosidase, partial [Candidatus Hodarchaeota archaeon]
MVKITFIGAGSIVFSKQLLIDILNFEELRNITISLMDIDEKRLQRIEMLCQKIKNQENLPTKFEATTDRRKALKDADFVVIMIQVGGLEATKFDLDIPEKYGMTQCIGDTLGPGGVFRFLRTIPVLLDICSDMKEVSKPGALILNYANPMAMNCWALNEATTVPNVGLCHGVQHTAYLMSHWANVPIKECTYLAAGINHMAWFLEFRRNEEDLYPIIRKKLFEGPPIVNDKIRIEMFRQVGYYMTESSGHLSEYLPFFRKRKPLMDKFGGSGFDGEDNFYYKLSIAEEKHDNKLFKRLLSDKRKIKFGRRSVEYCSRIIHGIVTGTPFRFNGNVRNTGLITNLPDGCCVEVPCYADATGIHPSYVGELPPVCAALNMSNIMVQGIAVKAALTKNRELVHHAVMMDPNTNSFLAPHEIREMVDALFEAES